MDCNYTFSKMNKDDVKKIVEQVTLIAKKEVEQVTEFAKEIGVMIPPLRYNAHINKRLEEKFKYFYEIDGLNDEIIFSQINETTYLFEGKTLLNDFLKIVDIEDDFFEDIKGDADTIAGIILELTGEIPAKNKRIDYKNLTFTIESVDKRRIKQIKVTINE